MSVQDYLRLEGIIFERIDEDNLVDDENEVYTRMSGGN